MIMLRLRFIAVCAAIGIAVVAGRAYGDTHSAGPRAGSPPAAQTKPTAPATAVNTEWRWESLFNLHDIGLVTAQYLNSHGNIYPNYKDIGAFKKAVSPYLPTIHGDPRPTKGLNIFLQPGAKKAYGLNPSLSGRSLASISNPEETVLIYDTVPDTDGNRCVGYVDGRSKQIGAQEWGEVKKGSKIP